MKTEQRKEVNRIIKGKYLWFFMACRVPSSIENGKILNQRLAVVIVISLMVIAALSCGKDNADNPLGPEESTYTVSGKVIDDSGFAADSVTVHIAGSNVNETIRTDFNGIYSFSGIPDGEYTITPSKAGYIFGPQKRKVNISGNNNDVEEFIGALIDENQYSIVGRIVDTSNIPVNTFIANIIVLDDSTNESSNTFLRNINSNGFFYFSEAAKNKRYLIYLKENSIYSFSPDSCYVTIQDNVTVCDFTLSYSGPQRHTLSGRVLDKDGNVFFGQEVRIVWLEKWIYYSTQTDSYGFYSLQVEDGTYWIQSLNRNYRFSPVGITRKVDGEDIIIPDFISYYVGPTLYKLLGSVLDSDGNAIPGVTIKFLKLGETETDSDGTFESNELDNLLVRENIGTTIVSVVPEKSGFVFSPDTTFVTMIWQKKLQYTEIILPDIIGTEYLVTDYFPLKTGAYWIFKRTVDDGSPAEHTVSVSGTVTEKGLTYPQLTPGYPAFFSTYRIEGDKVYALTDEGKEVIYLKFGIPDKTEWVIDIIRSDTPHIGIYHGLETVGVSAGTFIDCLHFETRVMHGENSYESTEMWFARGVGLVKAVRALVTIGEVRETQTDVLKEYGSL
ncbi:MAG: carboxypeptidase regulatory-like domain-containing protein [Candidatus Latescibacteria bacterium]|jgi:hypothetical protein|nr:carboxypeptidase regulatory-like domain-containing protein [Candidatus Latescibacterota bacterium]